MYDTKNDRFCNQDFIVKDLFKDNKKLKLLVIIFYHRSVPYGKNCVSEKKKKL